MDNVNARGEATFDVFMTVGGPAMATPLDRTNRCMKRTGCTRNPTRRVVGTTVREEEPKEAKHRHAQCLPPSRSFVEGWRLDGVHGLFMRASVLVFSKASLLAEQDVKHCECVASKRLEATLPCIEWHPPTT